MLMTSMVVKDVGDASFWWKLFQMSMFLNFHGQKFEHLTMNTPKKFMAIQLMLMPLFSLTTPMHSSIGAIQITIKKFHFGKAPPVDQNQLSGDPKERAPPHGLICSHMALKLHTISSKSCSNTGTTSIKTAQEHSIVTNSVSPTQKCRSCPPTLKWTFWTAIVTVFWKAMNWKLSQHSQSVEPMSFFLVSFKYYSGPVRGPSTDPEGKVRPWKPDTGRSIWTKLF